MSNIFFVVVVVVGGGGCAAVDDLAIKTFSAGSVALQVNLGRGLINSAFDIHTIQDPAEKELAQRRLDCRKHLLEMRSRNADMMDPESGGQTVMQQEDLQVCFYLIFIFFFKLPAIFKNCLFILFFKIFDWNFPGVAG